MAQQNTSEEVDLRYLFRKSNDLFKGFIRTILRIVDFFIKFYIIIILLIIVGVVLGYFKDKNDTRTYENNALVIPNVENVDYLYDKVEAINAKIGSRDTIFLNEVFKENNKAVTSISIEPIVDVYNFISKSRENIDILRILSQNQDVSDYVEDLSTSKYYKYHRLQIGIRGKEVSEKVLSDLFIFLNENEHFVNYQNVYRELKSYEIKEYYAMIAQVDSLVKATSKLNNLTGVSVTTLSELHELIESKKVLIKDLYRLNMEKQDYTSPIKVVSTDYNIKPKTLIDLSYKVKYPLYLVLTFSFIFLFIYAFKNLRRYSEAD